jgi:hypothetical protein
MTLIITVEARSHIVVTADGRSTGKIESNTLQKIFPHPNRGFAIAHHGQNLIDNRRVEDIANEFLVDNANVIGKSSIQPIARLFMELYGGIIRKTLGSIPGNKGCGFLFLGFEMVTKGPKIYEAFWATGQANTIAPEKHNDLILSGDGKRYIQKYVDDPKEKQFRQKNLLKGTFQNAKSYSDKLYGLAEEAQTKTGEDIFGGHKHQLAITGSGCQWLIPPK